MCGIWTMDRWDEAAQNPERSGYSLLDTRYNAEGQRASRFVSKFGSIYNVYSFDGEDYTYHGSNKSTSTRELNKRGFTLTEEPEPVVEVEATQANPTVALVEELDAEATAALNKALEIMGVNIEISTVVEGRTIAQWAKVGMDNENRSGEDHIHPTKPESFAERTPETLAYALSLTLVESEILGMLTQLEQQFTPSFPELATL